MELTMGRLERSIRSACAALILGTALGTASEAQAQGRRGNDAAADKGTSALATLITYRGKDIENVEVREEKFAKIRYRPRGGRIEEISGADVKEVRYLSPPPAFATGMSQLRAGLYAKAVTSFTAARNAAEDGSWVWFHGTLRLGESQMLGGSYAEAQKEFERLLGKDAEHFLAPEAIYLLGRSQSAAGAHAKALSTFGKLDSGFGVIFSARGRLDMGDPALGKGDPTDARKHFKFAEDRAGLRHQDLRRAAKVGVGKSFVADKRWDDAVQHFDAIISEPGVAAEVAGGAWVGKGDCKLAQAEERSGDKNLLKEALIAYQTCAVRYAGTPEAYPKALFQSAMIYEKLGLPQLASHMRDELKSRSPNSPWAAKLDK